MNEAAAAQDDGCVSLAGNLIMVLAGLCMIALFASQGIDIAGTTKDSAHLEGYVAQAVSEAHELEEPEYGTDGWPVADKETVRDLKSYEIDRSKGHGTTRHADEAQEVYDCLDRNGPYQGWVFRDNRNQYLRFCDLGPHDLDEGGRWYGVNIIKRDITSGRWVEVSTYIPKLVDRTLNGLLNWLAELKWVMM